MSIIFLYRLTHLRILIPFHHNHIHPPLPLSVELIMICSFWTKHVKACCGWRLGDFIMQLLDHVLMANVFLFNGSTNFQVLGGCDGDILRPIVCQSVPGGNLSFPEIMHQFSPHLIVAEVYRRVSRLDRYYE